MTSFFAILMALRCRIFKVSLFRFVYACIFSVSFIFYIILNIWKMLNSFALLCICIYECIFYSSIREWMYPSSMYVFMYAHMNMSKPQLLLKWNWNGILIFRQFEMKKEKTCHFSSLNHSERCSARGLQLIHNICVTELNKILHMLCMYVIRTICIVVNARHRWSKGNYSELY